MSGAYERIVCRPPIAPRLYEDVEHVAVLVHGPPQILLPPPDLDEQFIQMPGVALARVGGSPLEQQRPEVRRQAEEHLAHVFIARRGHVGVTGEHRHGGALLCSAPLRSKYFDKARVPMKLMRA